MQLKLTALGQAGVELVDEATEDDLLVDADKLADLGVKNKKHLKKLTKLKTHLTTNSRGSAHMIVILSLKVCNACH